MSTFQFFSILMLASLTVIQVKHKKKRIVNVLLNRLKHLSINTILKNLLIFKKKGSGPFKAGRRTMKMISIGAFKPVPAKYCDVFEVHHAVTVDVAVDTAAEKFVRTHIHNQA